VYQLKKNTNSDLINPLGEDQEDEKRDHNVYLKASHWNFLDAKAEAKGVSRNQVLRTLLDQVIGDSQ
jgi:hypothetical protein